MRRGTALVAAVALAEIAGNMRFPDLRSARHHRVLGAAPMSGSTTAIIEEALTRRAPGWGAEFRYRIAETIDREAKKHGFDPLLVMAVIAVESEFQENAVSSAAARGLMQMQAQTRAFAADLEGVKLSNEELDRDATLNVRLGVAYLKWLTQIFKGNLEQALLAYNVGPSRAYKMFRSGKDVNLYYVHSVQRQYARMKSELGLSDDWAIAARWR